jgi:ABC-2 type transport system permease protein
MNWEVRTMQSKTSSFETTMQTPQTVTRPPKNYAGNPAGLFNRALYRKNLSRFWPLWAMATFLGALVPLGMLMQLLRMGEQAVLTPLEVTSAYYTVLTEMVPAISLVYALLCALCVWGYLFNSRSVGMMHTLPIRRKALMFTNFLSGMTMMLIPYAVTGALTVLIAAAYGGFDPAGVANTVLGVLGISFFYYASATFVVMVTGNAVAMPVLYFVLHFLAVAVDALVSVLAAGFIPGFNGVSGTVNFLSPTVELLTKLGVSREYREVSEPGVPWIDYKLTSVTLENFWLVGVYALVGVVLLVLAWQMYSRRRSESAGDVVAVGWMKPVFRYGVAICAALAGGQALYAIFWTWLTGSSAYFQPVPLAVCMAVAGLIGYYAASMLLAKTVRVFRRSSLPGAAAVAVVCVVVVTCLQLDVLGVAARVPSADEVQTLQLYAQGNDYTLRAGEDDALLEQVLEIHRAIVADKDALITAGNAFYSGYPYEAEEGDQVSYTTVELEYQLANGGKLRRFYHLPIRESHLSQEDTYEYQLDQLLNSQEMREKRLHLNDPDYTISGGEIWTNSGEGYTYSFSSREAQEVLEAVARDAEAGRWGKVNWFGDDDAQIYALDLSLSFNYTDADGNDRTETIGIVLTPKMTETVACLLDMGAVSQEELVTNGELYPDRYGLPATEAVPDNSGVETADTQVVAGIYMEA